MTILRSALAAVLLVSLVPGAEARTSEIVEWAARFAEDPPTCNLNGDRCNLGPVVKILTDWIQAAHDAVASLPSVATPDL